MNRRTLLAAGAAAFALPHHRAQAAAARREFRILRDGSDIGRHVLSARADQDRFEIDIDIEIVVRVLGIAAYRYELTNREVWQGGRILSVEARTNDDGEKTFATMRRAGEALEIDGSAYAGVVAGEAVTTSYYATDFLSRRPWISTQTGKPLDIAIAGAPPRVTVSGELPTTLLYDSRGEWMGSIFDAGGEQGSYEIISDDGAIAPLWRTA